MIEFDIDRCPHCGQEIGFEANTCPECGAELPDDASYCPECGENVEEYYLTCDNCSKDITEEDIEAFNQLSEEEKEEHVRHLHEEIEAQRKDYEEYLKQREKQRREEAREYRARQKAIAEADESTINAVRDLVTPLVETFKYAKIESDSVCIMFEIGGLSYRVTVKKTDWKPTLTKLLDSIRHLPTDVRYYKIDMLGR